MRYCEKKKKKCESERKIGESSCSHHKNNTTRFFFRHTNPRKNIYTTHSWNEAVLSWRRCVRVHVRVGVRVSFIIILSTSSPSTSSPKLGSTLLLTSLPTNGSTTPVWMHLYLRRVGSCWEVWDRRVVVGDGWYCWILRRGRRVGRWLLPGEWRRKWLIREEYFI